MRVPKNPILGVSFHHTFVFPLMHDLRQGMVVRGFETRPNAATPPPKLLMTYYIPSTTHAHITNDNIDTARVSYTLSV